MIEYRQAEHSDIQTLADMKVDMISGIAPCTPEFKSTLRENVVRHMAAGFSDGSFAVFVAVQAGNIVGMSSVSFYTLPPNDWSLTGETAYIGNMYTLPAHRGNGIASKLLELNVKAAKSRGCDRILLDATDMGRPVYERFGFKASDTAMVYQPED